MAQRAACFRSSSVSLCALSRFSLSFRISSFDFNWANWATSSAFSLAACSSASCCSSLVVVSFSFDSTYQQSINWSNSTTRMQSHIDACSHKLLMKINDIQTEIELLTQMEANLLLSTITITSTIMILQSLQQDA